MTGFARTEEAFGNLERSIGGYAARFVQHQDTADFALDAQRPRDFDLQYAERIRMRRRDGKLALIRLARGSFARHGLVDQLGQADAPLDRLVIDEMELRHHPELQPMRQLAA